MKILSPLEVLRSKGYRDTMPRRLVVEALQKLSDPASPYDIQKWIGKKHGPVSPVTVYRIIELLEGLNIVHKHPCSGKFALCNLPNEEGLHGFLHCHSCGTTDEFCSKELSEMAKKQAAKNGFKRAEPMLEIIGTCSTCALR